MERKSAIALLAAIAALVIVGEALSSWEGPVSASPGLVIERTATVSRIIDGDTVLLEGGEKVRLAGINAPELDEPGGEEAREFVEDLCTPGTEVGLDVDDLDPKDRSGRTLAVVHVKVGGSWTNLNAELLQNGFAEVMFIPPSEFNPYEWRVD